MGMACTVCNHPQRIEIDRSIACGMAHAKIARDFGVSADAVRHHSENHLTRQLVAWMEKKEAIESHNLIAKIDDILLKTKLIFERNYSEKKDYLALKALDSQRNTLELLSKIAFALHQARANELEMERLRNQEKEDADIKLCLSEFMGRLSDEEQCLFTLLIQKASGEIDEIVIPEKYVFPEFKPEPQVIEEIIDQVPETPVTVQEETPLRIVKPVPPREIPSGKKVRSRRYVLPRKRHVSEEKPQGGGNSGGFYIPGDNE